MKHFVPGKVDAWHRLLWRTGLRSDRDAEDVAFQHELTLFLQGGGSSCDFGRIVVLVSVGRHGGIEVGHQGRDSQLVLSLVRRMEEIIDRLQHELLPD